MAAPEATRGSILWLASYPKSGNTWLRLMLAAYFGERAGPLDINHPGVADGIASSRELFDETLGLDSSEMTDAEIARLQPLVFTAIASQADGPVWLKVHDARRPLEDGAPLFPREISAGAVCLVRNPLDIAVSLAFHLDEGGLDKAVAMLCDARTTLGGGAGQQLRQRLGDWSGHVASWADQGEIPVLVLRYEDMLADAATALGAVVRFARPGDGIVPGRIAAAVAETDFERLQAAEARTGFRERRPRQRRFFRQGRAGAWRDHLAPAQVRRIVDCHGPMMARFGYLDAQGGPTG